MTDAIFCLGKARESSLYQALEHRILARCPDATVKHDRTQTAFIRKVQFTWLSLPRRRADAGALMLSIGLPARENSPRILHAAEVAPGRWMHHIIIRSAEDFDDEVAGWVSAAWALIGPGQRHTP